MRSFWEAAFPRAYAPLVEEYGPPAGNPDLYLYAIMRKESGFDPHDVSYADARGLLQMIPPTSARVAARAGEPFFADELYDPAVNIHLGALYIGSLFKKFGGEIPLSAGAYNAGRAPWGAGAEQHAAHPTDEFVELIAFAQTREYAKRVASLYAKYRYLDGPTPFEIPASSTPRSATVRPGLLRLLSGRAVGAGATYNDGMAKFRGTICRNDLEGGHWQLEADDCGRSYVLEGPTAGIEQDGAKVEIDGAVDKNAMGFAMAGPILRVKSGKKILVPGEKTKPWGIASRKSAVRKSANRESARRRLGMSKRSWVIGALFVGGISAPAEAAIPQRPAVSTGASRPRWTPRGRAMSSRSGPAATAARPSTFASILIGHGTQIVGCDEGPVLFGDLRVGYLPGDDGRSGASGTRIEGFLFDGRGISDDNLEPLALGVFARFADDVQVEGNRFLGGVQAITNTAGDRRRISENRIEALTLFDCGDDGLCAGGDGIVVHIARDDLAAPGGPAAPVNRPEGNIVVDNHVAGAIPDGFDEFSMAGIFVLAADNTLVARNRLVIPDNPAADASGDGVLISNVCCGGEPALLPGARNAVVVENEGRGSQFAVVVEGRAAPTPRASS